MNLYLISSSSRVLLTEKQDELIQNQNKIIYNAQEQTLEDIINEASYVSMFGEMKYILVKNANYFGTEKLKEQDEKMLLKYMENPYPLTTIIFTTYEPIDERKKVTKMMKEKGKVILIDLPKGIDLYNKVADRLIEKKYIAEKETINYLINACLNNYDLICNEIEKIDLYYQKPTKINLETIKNLVSKTIVDNNFKFVDAVIQKDIKKAFQYLEDLTILKIEPLTLINLLAREYRNMLSMKLYEEKKINKKEIQQELKLQTWQYDKTKKNADTYHKDDLKDYLIELEKLDVKIKSGQIDKTIGLKLFILNLFEY